MPQALADQLASVDALFQDASNDAPGCAVGVVRDGVTVFAKGRNGSDSGALTAILRLIRWPEHF